MPIVPETEMTADRLTAEERAEWRAVYCDDARIIALLDALDAAERERDGWKESAAQFVRNMGYYRDMVDAVAPLFGEALYTADDGVRHPEPLRAKFVEVVQAYCKERDAARAQVETLARALRWYAKLETWPRGYIGAPTDHGGRARAALKEAGIEP